MYGQYLTKEEYQLLGGKYDIEDIDLYIFQLEFDSIVHPNTYMITNYFNDKGHYTVELKMAMKIFVDYLIENKGVLSHIPKARVMVGTTGIAYGEKFGESWGQLKWMVPVEMKLILKKTNLLSTTGWNGKGKMVGTPWAKVSPSLVPKEGSTSAVFDSYGGTTFPLEEAFSEVPTHKCELYRNQQVVTPGTIIQSDTSEQKLLGTCTIQYEDIQSTEQTRGYSIFPGVMDDGTPMDIQINDMVIVKTPTGDVTRVVEENHFFFESGTIHHIRVLLS